MLQVLGTSWALLLGIGLLMVGNGVQGTLLGIRGSIEGFTTFQLSVIMSAYFVGFLGGSRLAPELIRRVGHVRVFAALGSLISALLVLYAAVPDWVAWTLMRILIGFCFSGVYVTAESWLNNAATNETRGKTLSLYMIVQMLGIITAQGLMNVADPAGFTLFIIPSVLVSLAFTPILLSISPAPVFDTTKPMSFRKLFEVSPLGCIGMFLMGGVYAALFGMAAVWGTMAGLLVFEISMFIAMIFTGGLVFQYPIGWISDRMDRRKLIAISAGICGAVALVATVFPLGFYALLVAGLLIGGIANPLYSLLLAYTSDYLDREDMASASGGLLFINGLGAIAGPLITGWIMGIVGPSGFFLYITFLTVLVSAYAFYRMTRRAAPSTADTGAYTVFTPAASALAMEAAYEAAQEGESTADPDQPADGREGGQG
ncbi:MFS transporter [Alkalilacustris brevis]|uniref:MFS transporter n=1 Tax=Alkalilacustris brevis TaxID=2026338 RepID=UPI000E0D9428|nr:MFS transporter [Alkalilacustris brevis]